MKKKEPLLFFIGLFFMAVIIMGELQFISLYGGLFKLGKFRRMYIEAPVVEELVKRCGYGSEEFVEAVTSSMLGNGYEVSKVSQIKRPVWDWRRLFMKPLWEKADRLYGTVFKDIRCFPVLKDTVGGETLSFEDSWMGERSYGGKRFHEGTDIMTSNNERGYFTVVSMTDGVVEKMGWLEKGGYRIGIRSPSGAYFYYAHLYSYEEGLKQGDVIQAGEVLGKMGDSGYGKMPGTVGNFDVHLHMGIYVDLEGKETSINPYHLLRYWERFIKN